MIRQSRALSIATRGRLYGAVSPATIGYVVLVYEEPAPIPTGGRTKKSSYIPVDKPFKIVTITVICEDNHIYHNTIVVSGTLEVSAKDVQVVKTEDGEVEILVLLEPYVELF